MGLQPLCIHPPFILSARCSTLDVRIWRQKSISRAEKVKEHDFHVLFVDQVGLHQRPIYIKINLPFG